MKIANVLILLSVAMLMPGCADSSPKPVPAEDAKEAVDVHEQDGVVHVVIEPSEDAQTEAQEALLLAEPGDVIEFSEGTFDFDGTLSLDGISNVTIRGQGMDKTILSFAKLGSGQGGEGMKVKADNFTIEDLTIEDTPGDAIKLQDCNGLTMRRIRTWWTGGPDAANGAYGLYPVMSTNVLIEDCVAECASDAGIYVGQSKQVVVRNCRTERNVAGIEIENCIGADVYDNVATNNTGGILVFSLPGLTLKNGSDCRVFNNQMIENNHANFAKEGAMVASVPPGSGLMIMANDRVEVFGNKFEGNISAGCLVVSFMITQRKFDDRGYDPYPEAIHIHDNTFSGGGTDPQGEYLSMYAATTSESLPDIVFDGVLDSKKLVEGDLPMELNLSVVDNGDASFVNLDLSKVLAGAKPEFSTDISRYAGSLERVPAVEIPGVK